MKKIILFICSIITFTAFNAQKHEFLNPPKFNEADLSKPKSLIDENAPAEFLYRSESFVISGTSGVLSKRYFYRIKIYNKDKAEKWLNLEIPLFQTGGAHEYLSNMKASTYNLENGKVVTTKIDKDSRYKSKEDENILIAKLAFPNVKDGSVLEYKYEIESPFLFSIPGMIIEEDIPSLYTEYVLNTPINVLYNINYVGAINPNYKLIDESHANDIQYKTYKFGFDNVKGFKTEKFVNNDRNYRGKISAELHSTTFSGNVQQYSMSWEQIRKMLYENKSFGGQLEKTKLAKENMPADVLNMKNNTEKANAVFKYVRDTFTWNKKRGIGTENGFKKLLETKSGNAADINLFLVLMLREAGLKAEPLVISTVDNGLINMAFPDASKLDFVIAAIENKDGYLLYDATSKQSSLDELPARDWNQYGIIFSKESAKQIQMVNSKSSFRYLNADVKIDDNGSITGNYSEKNKGTFAMLAKEVYDENADKYKKQYKENFDVDFTDINSKVLDNGEFESTMKFSSENLIDRVGKKMIINPMLFLSKNSNEFDQTGERKYRIDFITPYTKVKKVILEIPEGYTIEEMPKNKRIVTEDKEIEYSYAVEQKGNKLEVTSTTKIASPDYPKEYYPAFKKIWETASKNENQVISLIKK